MYNRLKISFSVIREPNRTLKKILAKSLMIQKYKLRMLG